MTENEARAAGYRLVEASPYEVGLIKGDVGIRTWWASEFDGKMPPLSHHEVMKAIEIYEDYERIKAANKE